MGGWSSAVRNLGSVVIWVRYNILFCFLCVLCVCMCAEVLPTKKKILHCCFSFWRKMCSFCPCVVCCVVLQVGSSSAYLDTLSQVREVAEKVAEAGSGSPKEERAQVRGGEERRRRRGTEKGEEEGENTGLLGFLFQAGLSTRERRGGVRLIDSVPTEERQERREAPNESSYWAGQARSAKSPRESIFLSSIALLSRTKKSGCNRQAFPPAPLPPPLSGPFCMHGMPASLSLVGWMDHSNNLSYRSLPSPIAVIHRRHRHRTLIIADRSIAADHY